MNRRHLVLGAIFNLVLEGCSSSIPEPEESTSGSAGGNGGSGGNGGESPAICGSTLQNEFAKAVEGLLYLSESDYPFEILVAPSSGSGAITPPELFAVLGLPKDTAFELRTFDQFFTPLLLSGQDGPRYQALRDLLEARLSAPQVIRFDMIQVKVYLVGRSSCGEIAGVHTISIET